MQHNKIMAGFAPKPGDLNTKFSLGDVELSMHLMSLHIFAYMQHNIGMKNIQIGALNIYIYGPYILFQGPIYTFMAYRYIYIYSNIYPLVPTTLHTYIYIYAV